MCCPVCHIILIPSVEEQRWPRCVSIIRATSLADIQFTGIGCIPHVHTHTEGKAEERRVNIDILPPYFAGRGCPIFAKIWTSSAPSKCVRVLIEILSRLEKLAGGCVTVNRRLCVQWCAFHGKRQPTLRVTRKCATLESIEEEKRKYK